MEEAGLPMDRALKIGKPPLSIEDGAAAAMRLLDEFPDTDCVFCVSDAPAFGVLSVMLKLGKSVPGDIGIAGFGDFEVSRFATPTISTVSVDPKTIGRETGQLIGRLLSDRDNTSRTLVPVPVNLTFRDSTK